MHEEAPILPKLGLPTSAHTITGINNNNNNARVVSDNNNDSINQPSHTAIPPHQPPSKFLRRDNYELHKAVPRTDKKINPNMNTSLHLPLPPSNGSHNNVTNGSITSRSQTAKERNNTGFVSFRGGRGGRDYHSHFDDNSINYSTPGTTARSTTAPPRRRGTTTTTSRQPPPAQPKDAFISSSNSNNKEAAGFHRLPMLPLAASIYTWDAHKKHSGVMENNKNHNIPEEEMKRLEEEEAEEENIRQILVREKYENWIDSYNAEVDNFASVSICCELILKSVCESTAHMGTPNALRTAACCFVFDKVLSIFGRYKEIVAILKRELFSAIYANYIQMTEEANNANTAADNAPTRAYKIKDYLRLTSYFEAHKDMQNQFRKFEYQSIKMNQTMERQHAVLNKGITRWQLMLKDRYLCAWRKYVKRRKRYQYIIDRLFMRRNHTLLKKHAFEGWRAYIYLVRAEKERRKFEQSEANFRNTLMVLKSDVDVYQDRAAAHELAKETAEERVATLTKQLALAREENERLRAEIAKRDESIKEEQATGEKWRNTARMMLISVLGDNYTAKGTMAELLTPEEEQAGIGEDALHKEAEKNPAKFLLRWFNFHLRKANHPMAPVPVTNFSTDIRDSARYIVLLNKLAPRACSLKALQFGDFGRRAEAVLRSATKLGINIGITVNDIITGAYDFNMVFVAQIFTWFSMVKFNPNPTSSPAHSTTTSSIDDDYDYEGNNNNNNNYNAETTTTGEPQTRPGSRLQTITVTSSSSSPPLNSSSATTTAFFADQQQQQQQQQPLSSATTTTIFSSTNNNASSANSSVSDSKATTTTITTTKNDSSNNSNSNNNDINSSNSGLSEIDKMLSDDAVNFRKTFQKAVTESQKWSALASLVQNHAMKFLVGRNKVKGTEEEGDPDSFKKKKDLDEYSAIKKERIIDLLEKEKGKDPDESVEEIHRVLQENQIEIRRIYQFYAAVDTGSALMSLNEFWRFCHDCKLGTSSSKSPLTKSAIDLIFVRANWSDEEASVPSLSHQQSSASLLSASSMGSFYTTTAAAAATAPTAANAKTSRGKPSTAATSSKAAGGNSGNNNNNSNSGQSVNAYNPDRELTPREFIECLVRMGAVKYSTVPNTTIAQRLQMLIEKDMLPRACKSDIDSFRKEIYKEATQNVLRRHIDNLDKVFRHYAKLEAQSNNNTNSSSNANSPPSITNKTFLAIMKDCNFIDSRFTHSDVASIFSNMQDDDNPADNVEMVFHEFLEAMVAVAVFKNPAPFLPLAQRVDQCIEKQFLPAMQQRVKLKLK